MPGLNPILYRHNRSRKQGATVAACSVAVLICSSAMLSAAVLFLSGCGPDAEPKTVDRSIRNEIAAASFPVAYLAREITAGLVPIDAPAPPGIAPEVYRPSREAIERFQRARIILINGAGLEPWVQSVSLPRSRLVSTADGFIDRWLTIESGVTHTHGLAGEHTHRGPDGYTWLDPALLAEQAKTTHAAIRDAFPEHAEVFDANLAVLLGRIAELESRVVALAAIETDRRIISDAPSFNYLARRLGVTIEVTTNPPEDDSVVLIDGVLPATNRGQAFVLFPVYAGTPMDESVDLIDAISAGLDGLSASLAGDD